jgi:hypothetical protein
MVSLLPASCWIARHSRAHCPLCCPASIDHVDQSRRADLFERYRGDNRAGIAGTKPPPCLRLFSREFAPRSEPMAKPNGIQPLSCRFNTLPCMGVGNGVSSANYCLMYHDCGMQNDEPKKSEGKFSEVARKSREKRAEMEQRKRDQENLDIPEPGNGGTDVKDS